MKNQGQKNQRSEKIRKILDKAKINSFLIDSFESNDRDIVWISVPKRESKVNFRLDFDKKEIRAFPCSNYHSYNGTQTLEKVTEKITKMVKISDEIIKQSKELNLFE